MATKALLEICSYCTRLVVDGEPVDDVTRVNIPDNLEVTHVCCNPCLAAQRAELRGRKELQLATDLVTGKYAKAVV